MNVLLFVMSMLMLLAVLTYGRLESFRNFAFVQSQFKEYMEVKERQYVNEEAIKRYKSTVASSQEKARKDEIEKNPASSKLSFNLFINKEERDAHQEDLETHLNITKNLIQYLYGDQPFYKKMEEKRPNFLNEIFNILMSETENKKIVKKKEIATIDLGDLDLNDVFTKMLGGSVDDPEKVEIPEDELGVAPVFEEREEKTFKPEHGYEKLLDFITIEKNKLKTRVFLASPQLLMALYGNEAVVSEILNNRYRLYRGVMNETMTKGEAAEEFKNMFMNMRLPEVPEGMLDFGVSKTNPRGYE